MTSEINRVAIVTGASRGIGAAVAERLARDGFTVVVNYAGNARRGRGAGAELEAAGGRALAAQGDVSDPDAVKRMFDAAEAAFGGVDVLVNNAGIMALAPLARERRRAVRPPDRHQSQRRFNTMREAAQRLRNGGRIINFSIERRRTVAADLRRLRRDEGGVEAMTQRARERDARPRHHRQRNRAGPDRHGSLPRRQIAGADRTIAKAAPLERLGQPEDIAAAVSFLAGPDGALDQRSDAARQRRNHLNHSSISLTGVRS